MNYREIQQQMHHYNQQSAQNQYLQNRQIYGQIGQTSNTLPSEAVRHIMRSQPQRQMSPVNNRGERPNSNYYEYDTAAALVPNHMPNHKQQQSSSTALTTTQADHMSSNTGSVRQSKKYGKAESMSGQQSGGQMGQIQVPIARQQQPIYSSNQVKIYGSTYSNGYSGHCQPQPNPPQLPIYDTIQGNSNAINANSNGYQISSKYQSPRPGSKV